MSDQSQLPLVWPILRDVPPDVMRAFQRVAAAVNTPGNGLTADRPIDTAASPLVVGRQWFDTTLGFPIWWNGTRWVDARGTPV